MNNAALIKTRLPHSTEDTRKREVARTSSLWLLRLLVILLFCQVWWEVGGFTIRLEDVLILLLLVGWLLPSILRLRLSYYRSSLNVPVLLWSSVLLLGVFISLLQPFEAEVKKDALVNGIRLLLASSLFSIVYNYPATSRKKARIVLGVVISFSFLTTIVALLQIAYWDGWLPISFPAVLTEFKEGANTQKGREIFALFIGDTGTHGWSGMLAMQSLTVFYWAQRIRHPLKRAMWYSYFGLLTLILVRTSVRNSILGLCVALVSTELLGSQKSRYQFNRLFKPVLMSTLALLLLGGLFYLAPDSYFIERVRQVIPQLRDGQIMISRASNVYGRVRYAGIAWKLFLRRPLVGNGFWSYETLSNLHAPEPIVHAHNSYFQTLAELGAVGAIALVWLIWRLLRYSRFIWRKRFDDSYLRVIQKLWIGGLVFIGFTALFSNPFWAPREVGFRMFLLGVLTTWSREAAR